MDSSDVDLDRFVGMDPDEAVLIANGEGITNIRILQSVAGRTTTPTSADLRRNRLNLMIEDGKVVKAMFF